MKLVPIILTSGPTTKRSFFVNLSGIHLPEPCEIRAILVDKDTLPVKQAGLPTTYGIDASLDELQAFLLSTEDHIAQFIHFRIEFDARGKIMNGDLYSAYNAYCQYYGLKPATHRIFTQRFIQYTEATTHNGTCGGRRGRYLKGVTLRTSVR